MDEKFKHLVEETIKRCKDDGFSLSQTRRELDAVQKQYECGKFSLSNLYVVKFALDEWVKDVGIQLKNEIH